MELIELMERLPAGTRIQKDAAKVISDRCDEITEHIAAEIAKFIEPGVPGDTPVLTWMDVVFVLAQNKNVGVKRDSSRDAAKA